MERIVEICCGSYEDALNAYHGGAKRIELNSALHLGGLTPSLASLKLTKKNTNLKVIPIAKFYSHCMKNTEWKCSENLTLSLPVSYMMPKQVN